ncbi:MAG: hypothetical protein WCG27_11510 [Pseudomonadota bacterium]
MELKYFSDWLKNKNQDIFTTDSFSFQEYFKSIAEQKLGRKRMTYLHLRRFYRFCLTHGHTRTSPVTNISWERPPAKVVICSNKHLHSLIKYIKNDKNDPEVALLLCLMLFGAYLARTTLRTGIPLDCTALSHLSSSF